MDNLVTIATFDLPALAHAARIALENEGIPAFLADNNLVTMDWFLSNAVGGAKLQVAAGDAARAREILDRRTNSPASAETPAADALRFTCQECGKTVVFPGDRRGQVEECPYCGNYVDVPEESDARLPAEQDALAPSPAAEMAPFRIRSTPALGQLGNSGLKSSPSCLWRMCPTCSAQFMES